MKNYLHQSKGITIAATVLLVVVACSFAVYWHLYTEKELWYEMFAAVLGVIITAIITMILLKGQSNNDVEREKQAKVFEEKLRIYQEYLHTLCEVIEDRNLSDKEKTRLQFQTSYIAMHTSQQHIEEISEEIKHILLLTCANGDGQEQQNASLLKHLFKIVQCFQEELYVASPQKMNADKERRIANIIKNFNDAYDTEEPMNVNREKRMQQSEEINQPFVQSAELSWKEYVSKWEVEGWVTTGLSEENDWIRIENSKGNPGVIDVGFHEGHYYIEASYLYDTDFSKPLKWEQGGRRTYGEWWKHLEGEYYDIPQGEFVSRFNTDSGLQHYIIGYVKLLMDKLQKHHRSVGWKNAVGSFDNWTIFIWEWETLACQFECESEGTPYLDVTELEHDGVVWILFSNRKDNETLLRNTLDRMGCKGFIQEAGKIVLEKIQATDTERIAERIKFWIQKIEG